MYFIEMFLENSQKAKDLTLAAIAEKSLKEVRYHIRFSSDWIKRLGDGTEESHTRMQAAIDDLWPYTDELFHQTEACKAMMESGIGVDTEALRDNYYQQVAEILTEATLEVPENNYFHKGGKEGIHTEHRVTFLLNYNICNEPIREWNGNNKLRLNETETNLFKGVEERKI